MTDTIRQEIAQSADRVVVKVGTRVLTAEDGQLNTQRVARLANELQAIVASGRQVVLVSSGAVGAGLSHLGWHRRPHDLAHLQAVAAIGQAKLIEEYDRHLSQHNLHAAQVLLTADDLDNRGRYLNIRNTLITLLELGTVPIVNENDTVAVDELMSTFGDNDRLAAVVTNLLRSPLLIILSDVAGLYDGDPRREDSSVVDCVHDIDQAITDYVRDEDSELSKGGMASKLEAARMLTLAGENVIVASGHDEGVLEAILQGHVVGTLFPAKGKSISPWKRWIGFSAVPKGTLVVDPGAANAVVDQGRSLLPIGIQAIRGQFEKGDPVTICSSDNVELGRGLSNYGSDELVKIIGCRTNDIASRLGHRPYDEAVHRDNMALTRSPRADG